MSENPGNEQPARDETPPRVSAQVFRPRANRFFAAVLLMIPVLAVAGIYSWYRIYRSPIWTDVTVPVSQPVLFSHQHHSGELQIDCRYCHTSVTTSSFAGIPPTETCMTCHSQILTHSPLIAPVVASYTSGEPMQWNRVHNVPDYVYFNHSIHVNKGVGCATCHGAVNEMPLVWKTQTLFMEWCLQCHRHPEENLRPISETFAMDWKTPADQATKGAALAQVAHLDTAHLTNCTVCHR